jgi:hypothetical protein
MAQQTAVEWLVEQIKDYDFTDPKTNEYLIFKIPIYSFIEKIEQAKEKEKEQIVQAFKTGYNVTEYDADDYFDLLYNQNK